MVETGIQDLNITQYSSVIPPEAETVTLEEAKPFLRHGAVMESIMARMQGVKGDRITAGVGRMQVISHSSWSYSSFSRSCSS